jgi:Mn2+/Fe2+ NRAMP family transporter
MILQPAPKPRKGFFKSLLIKLGIFFAVFGPATITAMADDDASGVATYAIAGAKLGFPILFALVWITVLLAITQEMGVRLSLVARKGLGDLIRERWGVRVSIFIFVALIIANMGTIITDMAAIKTTADMFGIPSIPLIIAMVVIIFFFVTKGNYKLTQAIMLITSLFFLVYIFAAFKTPHMDWHAALTNLLYPKGVEHNKQYWIDYLIIGMGVLGTTVTPWGQFFISSFASDKKIAKEHIVYEQIEAYWGAFLTDAISFFIIITTAATLFVAVPRIALTDGFAAAKAIEPFAGKLASTLFAVGILNAGFMGIVIVSLSTSYAFSEFFGVPGSLNSSFSESKPYYIIFLVQLTVAAIVAMIPGVNLFTIAIGSQALNAITLPIIFIYLIQLTNDKKLMGKYVNKWFIKYFSIICTVIISVAAIGTVFFALFPLK